MLEYRRLREREQRAAALESAEATSTALLRAVSHDLRTPLATMRASVDGLVGGEVDARRPARRCTRRSTPRPTSSRGSSTTCSTCRGCRAGWSHPVLRDRSLDEVLPLALAGQPPGAVVLDVDEPAPVVRTDAGLLERVVANLVSNAVRVSATGAPVRVLAHVLPERVEVMVVDRGPGVPGRAAGADVRAVPAARRHHAPAGSGLGLAVAQGLTEALGGDAVRRGHPRRRADHGAVAAAGGRRRVSATAAHTVLVVDDEPALARALAINLRAHGWEVVTAADGRSALDAAADHPPRRRRCSTSACPTWTAPR